MIGPTIKESDMWRSLTTRLMSHLRAYEVADVLLDRNQKPGIRDTLTKKEREFLLALHMEDNNR